MGPSFVDLVVLKGNLRPSSHLHRISDATDHDAEDREQPSEPTAIPDDEPEDDVLEQRQEVPYGDDDDR